MKHIIIVILLLSLFLHGCCFTAATSPDDATSESTTDPMATWNPFVGGFVYSAGRIFLQVIDGGERPIYNIAYRHRDESIEILEPDVSSYTTWKLVGQRLYFVCSDTLYAMDLPNGEHIIFEPDRQKYAGVRTILDIDGEQLLCGAQKWEVNTDPVFLGDRIRVDTRIWVKLDFSECYEVVE